MIKQNRLRLVLSSMLLILLFIGCSRSSGSCVQQKKFCPAYQHLDLSDATSFADDDSLPFRFPLEDVRNYQPANPYSIHFAACGGDTSVLKYHAAEDYLQPAGTEVYAMADGVVSFSGPKGGYGWLIIIDHPQANLYSLYGHLSPSRWSIENGPVKKGQLIGYLGDEYENGGTRENPLITHLHLGVRTDQREDYPTAGEWRWQAGWIKPCPQTLNWLQPSSVISAQEIPPGGFQSQDSSFIAKWGIELLFTAIYLVGGICLLIFLVRKDKPLSLLYVTGVYLAAGWYFSSAGWKMNALLFLMAGVFLSAALFKFLRTAKGSRPIS